MVYEVTVGDSMDLNDVARDLEQLRSDATSYVPSNANLIDGNMPALLVLPEEEPGRAGDICLRC